MRVLVSGASGLVGTALTAALRERGDEVGALVRRGSDGLLDVRWDPADGRIDLADLADGDFDAVVHLAGEPLDERWTREKRTRIMQSRVKGTALLAGTLAALDPEVRPGVLVCASAVGYYGDRGDELLTEESGPGEGFLAEVVQAWEAAAQPARDAGIRTVHLRKGVVQSPRGGALARMLLPFRLGLGGRVGSGRQFWAWVGLEEAVRMYLFALDDPRMEGPVNAVGPTPATAAEYATALGRVLNRPTLLPTPALAPKLLLGSQLVEEMLLASQKVVPARLEGLGYEFGWRHVEAALRHELGRD